MRSLRRQAFGVAAAALLALASPSGAQVTNPKDIKTPPLRKLSMPQPKRIQLDNGMVIFLMEDHELPLIGGTATIRGGERDVAADRAGLVQIYGQAWRTGGTQSKSGDELDDFLESRAARVETGGDEDSTNISLDVLKDDFNTVLPIFVDLLKNPAFRQDKIDLARTQANTMISRRNDEPQAILGRELRRLGYGAGSPYASQPEYATVAAITRADLVAFHDRFVHPNNIIVGMVGDFDSAAMEKKLRDAFASWPRGPQAPPPPAPARAISPAKPGVYFIPKSDVTQANIGFVEPGIQRNNPDYYALAVMNEVLSGGFSGRLMNHLRSQRGLTYGVGGGVGSEWDYPGLFRMQMSTKSGTTLESVEALKNEMADLRNKPFTDEELRQAKEAILNKFIFTMDSREKVLNQAVLLEFYGFPLDYFLKYPANIEKVTTADLSRVANKYVNPDQVAILVVGNEKDFERPLSTLGPVTPVDIAIPEPGAKPSGGAAPKPSASNAEGLALARKVQNFVGGKAKIDSIQAMRTAGTMSTKTPAGMMSIDIDSLTKYPDSRRNVMKTPMGEMTMVSTPDAAFLIGPTGVQDLPQSQRDAIRSEAKQDLFTVLRNLDNPAYTFTAAGTEKIGDVNAAVLEVNAGGAVVKWWVDPATGKILRRSNQTRMGEQVTDITEWKNVNGINVPSALTISINGQPSGGGNLTIVEINPPIDPKVFEKPEK